MWKLSLLCLAVLATACGREATPTSSNTPARAQAADLALPDGMTLVADVSKVCMINDQVMTTPQIPVPVDGKTYWGCCEMCKTRLATEPDARFGLDPVTGQRVDKATAVIVQDTTGKVRYFASEDTLRKWRL